MAHEGNRGIFFSEFIQPHVKTPSRLSLCNFKSCAVSLLLLSGFVMSSVNGSLMKVNDDQAVPNESKHLLQNRDLHRSELMSKIFAKYTQYAVSKQSLGENVPERLKRDSSQAKKRAESAYYTSDIFWNYGDENALSLENFDALLAHIGLKKMTRFANETTHDHDHTHHDHGHEDHDHEGHGHDHEGHDHDHEGHDHDHEGHDHDHEGHDHEGHDHDHNHRRKRESTDDHAGHNHADNATEEEYLKCLTSTQLLYDFGLEDKPHLSHEDFLFLCPALVYQLDMGVCRSDENDRDHQGDEEADGIGALVWLYTMLSVLVISLCALFGILCIPRKAGNENIVMQFLIALAMASMSGDGMLHLIPHSMVPHHDHGDEGHHDDEEAGHLDSLYKGLVVLIGIYTFFFLERCFAIFNTVKAAKNRRSTGASTPMVSIKGGIDDNDDVDAHGHSHQGIFSCTSLASMIIVGDMFHNFCDGLAIGAAFAGSLSLGLSTAIAVFCHELPHEIGDFAVLITSGMSAKKAIAFNMLSTVPCFLGAAIGLELGALGDVSLWIFAFVGGLFLYIALVDLVPEMTRAYTREGNPWAKYLLVHSAGMVTGVVIMLVLGIYEHDLQQILT